MYFFFSDNTELPGIYHNIAASFTNQYELVFSVPDTAADSELTVAVTDDQMREGEDSRTVAACP